MTQIHVGAADSARRRGSVAIGRWLEGLLLRLSPRTLAWSAVAAAIVILVQAGFLAALFVGPHGHSYRAPLIGQAGPPGRYALVGLVPQARAAGLTDVLVPPQAPLHHRSPP